MSIKAKRNYYKNEKALISIGKKIREIRLLNQISQEDLAADCEVDYSQINRMELGKVNFSVSSLYRIAEALNVNPKELLE